MRNQDIKRDSCHMLTIYYVPVTLLAYMLTLSTPIAIPQDQSHTRVLINTILTSIITAMTVEQNLRMSSISLCPAKTCWLSHGQMLAIPWSNNVATKVILDGGHRAAVFTPCPKWHNNSRGIVLRTKLQGLIGHLLGRLLWVGAAIDDVHYLLVSQ